MSVGSERFARAVQRMPSLLDTLLRAEKLAVKDRGRIPVERAVVYLFSESGVPVYVGQTRTPRRRYDQHTGPNRAHNEASFAFLKAKKKAESAGVEVQRSREALQTDAAFSVHFGAAKAWVAAMAFQYVEIEDPIERSIFEMYAALHLGTEEFNSFETH